MVPLFWVFLTYRATYHELRLTIWVGTAELKSKKPTDKNDDMEMEGHQAEYLQQQDVQRWSGGKLNR